MCERKSIFRKMSNCVCCSIIDLTLACRIVASIGIMISLWLVIIAFANGKFLSSDDDYDLCRKTATFLGLEWEHFHYNASIKYKNDPEGKMIFIVIIFYSFALLGVNLLLLIATLRHDWCFALAWLMFEALSCISRFASFIFQSITDPEVLGSIYFVGSIFTLAISLWWWFVVLFATISWKNRQDFNLEVTMHSLYSSTLYKSDVTDESTEDRSRI